MFQARLNISNEIVFLGTGRGTVGKCAGPKWPKMVQTTILVKMTFKWLCSELDFSIRETKMDQIGPLWPKEVHFGPFRSANRTLAIPELMFQARLNILGSS